MHRTHTNAPITAIVYTDGRTVEPVLRSIADRLIEQGMSVVGFVQRDEPKEGHRRCDMVLEELASGERIGISQYRGMQARGCMLDAGELVRAESLARAAFESQADLLVVNKFGKSEAEGGGFRSLISDAVSRGVPVLIAVPRRNLDAWRNFAGPLSVEIEVESLRPGVADLRARLGGIPTVLHD